MSDTNNLPPTEDRASRQPPRRADRGEMVEVWPHLLVRHGVVAIITLAVVVVLAIAVDAPFGPLADPQHTPNPEKAPWYYVGLQELLAQLPPVVGGVVVPLSMISGLIAVPFIDTSRFIRPRHRKVVVLVFTTLVILWVVVTLIGFMFRGPHWGWVWPWQEWHGVI